MMAAHPSRDDFEAYVLDALAPEAARALERHSERCDRCAERLAAEARREVALGALIPRLARRPAPAAPSEGRWRSPFLLAATSALGLLVLAVNPRAMRLPDSPPALLGYGACVGAPASSASVSAPALCLAEGAAAICGAARANDPVALAERAQSAGEGLFSCSDCFCRAERPQ